MRSSLTATRSLSRPMRRRSSRPPSLRSIPTGLTRRSRGSRSSCTRTTPWGSRRWSPRSERSGLAQGRLTTICDRPRRQAAPGSVTKVSASVFTIFAISNLHDFILEVGSWAGLASVLGLGVLSALYFSQARDVKRLREWAGRAPERSVEHQIGGRPATQAAQAAQAARAAGGGAAPPPAPAP